MRDLRDPQKLGEFMLRAHDGGEEITLSEFYDKRLLAMDQNLFPDVSKDDSMVKITVAEYRRELEQREDKYAQAALRDIDAGKGVQGYDDAGA